MPLTETRLLAADARLGIWTLTETEAELLALAPAWLQAVGIPARLTHPHRRREWLAGRVLATRLMADLTGTTAPVIEPDAFGRPRFAGVAAALALSHGAGCAAAVVALGAGRRAGIDVEPVRAKALLVAPRVLTPDEQAAVGTVAERAALAWSLKESLYKAYGRKQLDFRAHLWLDLSAWPPPPAALPPTGRVRGRIRHPATGHEWWHEVAYAFRPDGLLTYCLG